jgi:crotonobetaine/carnitine-CoA ligase
MMGRIVVGSAEPELDTPLHALARAVEQVGDRTALDFGGDKYSYRDIDRLSTEVAHGLKAAGLGAGDIVITMLDNNVDAAVLWMAVNKAEGIWVPVNTAFKQGYLLHQIADSEARLMVCEEQYLDRLVEISDRLALVRTIFVRGSGHPANPQCAIPLRSLDMLRTGNFQPLPLAAQPSDLACLLYTSGTTGPSKGCMVSHNYLCNVARHLWEQYPLAEDDVLWISTPLFHLAAVGHVTLAIKYQRPIAVMARFSVSGFWPDIERSGATVAVLIASMLPLIAHAPDNEHSLRCRGQIRSVYGAPITLAIREVFEQRFGVAYVNNYAYGTTEASKVTTVRYGERLPHPESAGRVFEDFDVQIVDDDDRPVPSGQPGELVYRPRKPHIMFEGYWRRPEETVKAWRGLWMHTGDVCKLDQDGALYFLDRKKDYMRRRGENISSFELEETFMAHPAIKEVAVHTVPSELTEDDIKVTAVLHEDYSVTEEELCLWSIERLPYFSVPRYIEFRAELPKNPVGRVLKFELRDQGCTPTTWDMERTKIRAARC